MHIDDWAKKWSIPPEAIEEFRKLIGISVDKFIKTSTEKDSEAYLQSKLRIDACKKGWRLWRNNVGAFYSKDNILVRYGLANDSSQLNKILKSSDLIGIKPIKITKDHVGTTIGQFVSRETKKSDWVFSGTEAEEAQLRWVTLILSLGGDAEFFSGEQ